MPTRSWSGSASSFAAIPRPSPRCERRAPTFGASAFGSRGGCVAASCRRPRRPSSFRRRGTRRTTFGSVATRPCSPPRTGRRSCATSTAGGTVCEPVDLPVNKRHFEMVYAHLRWSDKPFMGSVTHPDRARDTVEMAKIVFGPDHLDSHTVIMSLINANSPLVWDATMIGAARVYAEHNQAVIMTPFILSGAMSPATVAGTATQTLAEALAGMAYVQLVRPGAPVVLGSFASSISMQSGAPTFGTPEPALVLYVMGQLARRLGVPFRSGGALCASKIPDAQAAFESANTMQPTILGGVNFVF